MLAHNNVHDGGVCSLAPDVLWRPLVVQTRARYVHPPDPELYFTMLHAPNAYSVHANLLHVFRTLAIKNISLLTSPRHPIPQTNTRRLLSTTGSTALQLRGAVRTWLTVIHSRDQ